MILLIDNYDSFTYNLYQALLCFHAKIKVIRNDEMDVNNALALKPAGIVLSPGPKSPIDAGICIELIRAARGIPLLGVCLGHQAITVAFGGRVVQAPEIVHGKSDLIYHDSLGLYQNITSPFQAGRYHSLIAEKETLADALLVDSRNSKNMIMGLRHRHLPLFGVQFHPESILTPEGPRLLENFVRLIHAA